MNAWRLKGFMCICAALCGLYVSNTTTAEDTVVPGKEFYSALQAADPIRRDMFLDMHLNKIIEGKGFVDTIDADPRFHRNFRIVLVGSVTTNINLIFYVYTGNEEYKKMLNKNDLFEFKGQFIIYTPLSSRGDSYIFDVIMQDGAMVVE